MTNLNTSRSLYFVRSGGGGYTIRNVARCWAYETAVCLNTELSNDIPYNEYYEYYAPEYKLHIDPCDMDNYNTPNYLQSVKAKLLEYLHMLPQAPSVQFHDVPRTPSFERKESDPDRRMTQSDRDAMVDHEAELYSDEKDHDADASPGQSGSTDSSHKSESAGLTSNYVSNGSTADQMKDITDVVKLPGNDTAASQLNHNQHQSSVDNLSSSAALSSSKTHAMDTSKLDEE